jgi:carboxyl-terminal processing protease
MSPRLRSKRANALSFHVIMPQGRSRHLAAQLCLVAFLLFAASCRRADKSASLPSPSPATHALSVADRLRIIDEVWQPINEEFYDPSFNGVDWRAVRERYRARAADAKDDFEFYGLCELMTAELRDSHTHYEPPPSADETARNEPQGNAGLLLGVVEGKTVVVEVDAGTLAESAGVRPGMILRAVNGRPVEEVEAQLRSLVARSSSERSLQNLIASSIIYGRVWGLPRVLRLEGLDGREFVYEVRRAPGDSAPRIQARRLASGFAYIKFDKWQPPVDQQFTEELDKLRDAPGLVIDLRGNGGGQTDVMLNITSNFFREATYYGGFKTRAGGVDKYFTHPPAHVYDQPIVIIVDERSASASETSTLFMQESARAVVVGRQSAGATHNARDKKLPHGGVLTYSIRAYLTPQGRDPEGTGVVPDETVPLTIDDLRRGHDAALKAAERKLCDMTAAKR